MIALLFLMFVAAMFVLVITLIVWFRGRRAAGLAAVGLAAWFAFVGLLARLGILQKVTARPPGVVLVIAPVAVFVIVFILAVARCRTGPSRAPLWLLLIVQTFRVAVELFLHQLWRAGLIPKMLTFSGANVDIYIGASAPVIAWLVARQPSGRRVALAWNVLGLLVLGNVVIRAILTSPGPLNVIHAEVPNRLISTFPYLLIPAFFVPLAIALHVLAIREIVCERGAFTGRVKSLY